MIIDTEKLLEEIDRRIDRARTGGEPLAGIVEDGLLDARRALRTVELVASFLRAGEQKK